VSDEYERKYLKVDEALFFERQAQRRLLLLPVLGATSAIIGATVAIAGGGALASGLLAGLVGGAAMALYMGALVVFFGVARTLVNEDELRIEIGMLGPRCPWPR
jgi:hypothetical protein